MAEDLEVPVTKDKKKRYEAILPQIKALVEDEKDLIANLANIAGALKYGMNFFWVGFYIAKEGQLVLGPFQGPVACTRIPFHKGVCGSCYTRKETIIVPDVEKFPGHIACSSLSKSEIVVPVIKENLVQLVLDVDSDKLGEFNEIDKWYLEQITTFIHI